MNPTQPTTVKNRGSADVSYLNRTVDQMIWEFMQEHDIPGLTLAIVQAPYIPRVVGYGMSDVQQHRLASANTMWPIGPIAQAFTAVAIMQLVEDGQLQLQDPIGKYLQNIPTNWHKITILQLLHHAAGLPEYRNIQGWCPFKGLNFEEIVNLVKDLPLEFTPDTQVAQSATNFLVLTEIIEHVSGKTYHDFVTERQINFLDLKHTGFAEDLAKFHQEDLTLSENVHQLFKKDHLYIDPTETAISYDAEGKAIRKVHSSSFKGFSDIWASAQDISFWDIALAGSVLIHAPEHRAMLYAPWQLPNAQEIPAVAGWQFYKHRGLMDIKGSVHGYSAFLSRFTHPEELVCVTLLANKEGIDFTNLGRKIAGAFGDLLATNYNDNKLYLTESQFAVTQTVARLEAELKSRNIPIFAKFDHALNAQQAGLELRPTTVVVFGSPQVGTGLMQEDQSIALELPLKIAVWEDAAGSTWLAFPKLQQLAETYAVTEHPAITKMQALMEDLVKKAANLYT